MKHLKITILLAILMSMVGINVLAYDFEQDGFYYSWHNNNSEVYIDGSSYSTWISIGIPSSVTYENKTYPVTGISMNAFRESNITSVTIPGTVKIIEGGAFQYCLQLTRVTIENGVTSIGDNAFNGCHMISNLTLPNSVTSIGYAAFQYCNSLDFVDIPSSVTNISPTAFSRCTNLRLTVDSNNPKYDSRNNCEAIIETATNTLITGCYKTTIPNSVTSIGNEAFYKCVKLEKIVIPSSVTSIGSYAFDCSYTREITVERETPISISVTSFVSRNGYGATLYVPYGCKTAYEGSTYWADFDEIVESKKDVNQSFISVDPIAAVTYSGLEQTPTVTVRDESTVLTRGTDYAVVFSNNTNAGTATAKIIGIGNYKGSRSINFTIDKAPLTVTAENKTIPRGASLPNFKCSYTGFVNDETSSVFTTQPTYSCTATSTNTLGTYDINVSGAAAQNYSISYVKGTLTIVTTSSTIEFADANVKALCVANWDSDDDGELSFDEAAAVTSLGSVFKSKSIHSFDELSYFTGLTSIEERAFFGSFMLTSVEIPNSVTSIGSHAFCNSGLTSVTIPNSVTSIGSYAFGYSGLTSVTIPNSVTSIGDDAFVGCSGLTSVEIPNSVTSIGEAAFWNCSGLTSVTIPNSVTSIGDDAFRGCSGLTSVTIPNSVTSIGKNAFDGCSGLTSVTIPNSVTSIGDYAFDGCSGLTSVEIPNSVTSIGGYAFYGCSGLTEVTIPNSVTSIGSYAFGYSGLTSVSVESGNTVYDSRNNCNAIIITATNYLIVGCKNTVIPSSVTSIGSGAFYGCEGLTSVTIPNSVTSIGRNAFYGCSGLTSVTIPNSVTSIGYYAFRGCTGELTVNCNIPSASLSSDGSFCSSKFSSVKIGDNVESIGDYAFYYCSSLTSITIPNSVTEIGVSAFYECSNLTSVVVEKETPLTITSYTFSNRTNATLYVPAGCKAAYETANYWKEFKEIVELATTITMSANGICTYANSNDLDFSDVEGLTAYIISGFNPSNGTLTLTPVTEVPAGEGLLLKGAEGNYTVPYTTTDMVYSNLLTGVTTATIISPTEGSETNFILANGKHGINFYTLSQAGEIAAGKAYLHLPTTSISSLSRGFRLVYEDEITGIEEKQAEAEPTAGEDVYYDLQGRRVENPTHGIYIINGKKVLIK